jgi:pimeloyl-ACP methyl ester carboxylesterase
MDGSVWSRLWDRLPGFNHVAMDLPGHGGTPLGSGGVLKHSRETLLWTARAVGADRLVAMSYGGAVTLAALVSCPEIFRSTVLAAPGIPGGVQDPDAAACHLELLRMARERGIGPWLADRWLTVPPLIFAGARGRPEVFEFIEAVVRRHAWTELLTESFHDMNEAVISSRKLARIKTQLTLLCGSEDMMTFKRAAEHIRRSVASSRKYNLAGLGHMPLLEDPDACLPIVLDALS